VRVAVLEARSVGAVTTGHTTGKLSLLQGAVLQGIREHAGDDVLRAYVASNRAAQTWLRTELADEPGAIMDDVAVTYATTAEGIARLDREADAALVAGLDVERLSGDALQPLRLPFAVEDALLLRGQYRLQPMRVLGRLARRLRQDGVRIVTGCRVTGVQVEENGLVVQTTGGDVQASTLVLATGGPALDRGALFTRLSPSRSFAAAYELPAGSEVPDGMFLSVDPTSRSLRRDEFDGTQVLTVGGGTHTTGRESSTAALVAELDEWTHRYWPGAVRRTWWAAQDYRAVSRVPFAGLLPRSSDRVYAATGYDKWGMTNAIASALRISGALLGHQERWAATLDEHHGGLADIGETAQLNASVGGHLIADWIRRGVAHAPQGVPAEGEGRIVREGMSPVAESTVDGVTRRVSGVCTHLGGILSWNDAECSWDCPLHGSRFSAAGEVLEGPALSPLERVDDHGTRA
jgi:nitrite reductase/ring-hydroxylating ferredoxin subunit